MSFERNFYKATATCPKCGTIGPKPEYVPQDRTRYSLAWDMYFMVRRYESRGFALHGKYEDEEPSVSLIVPDKTINRCICGFGWEEK